MQAMAPDVRSVLEKLDFAILSGHRRVRPFGLKGGKPGETGRKDGSVEVLKGCDQTLLEAGEAFTVITPPGADTANRNKQHRESRSKRRLFRAAFSFLQAALRSRIHTVSMPSKRTFFRRPTGQKLGLEYITHNISIIENNLSFQRFCDPVWTLH